MANSINATSTGNGGIITTGDDSGVLNIQTNETTAISIDASQNATFTNGANLPNTFGFKNRLINGGMTIDQRNAGAASTSNGYVVDRWFSSINEVTGLVASRQRSTTAPSGFINSFLFSVTTGATPSSTQASGIYQPIEGLNTADLAWGTASASPVTLSFWVRSSITGTHSGSILNNAGNRAYPFTFTISAANTWEYKTVSLAGDTTGTWLTDTGVGIYVVFNTGSGSSRLATAGSWSTPSTNFPYGATGSVQLCQTTGATFYITGVQLEKGTQATSFDFRSYGTEFFLCQRYYQSWGGDSTYDLVAVGQAYGSTQACVLVTLQQKMRANPTLGYSAVGNFMLTGAGNTINAVTGLSLDMSATQTYSLNVTVGSGLTGGNATRLHANGTTSARLTMSAEL